MTFALLVQRSRDEVLGARLQRRLADMQAAEIIYLDARDPDSNVLADAVAQAGSEQIFFLDEYTLPQANLGQVSWKADALGGYIDTPNGAHVGYLLERSVSRLRQEVLQASFAPVADLVQRGDALVDAAAPGALITTRTAIAQAGGINRGLPFSLALIDLQISMRERGMNIVASSKLQLESVRDWHAATYFDLDRIYELRSREAWSAVVRRSVRRADDAPVALLIHGETNPERARDLIRRAGYPLTRILCTADQGLGAEAEVLPGVLRVSDVLTRHFEHDRAVAIAVASVTAAVDEQWLPALIDEIHESTDVGVATIGDRGESSVILAADARATLLVPARFPATFEFYDAVDPDDVMREATARAVRFGVASRATAGTLARSSAHALCMDRDDLMHSRRSERTEQPLVSIIVVATSRADSHRFNMDSLRLTAREPFELIYVVPRESTQLVQKLLADPSAKVILDDEDESLGGGLNRALTVADGEYIAVLSDELIAGHQWLDCLVDALERMPRCGVSAPLVTRSVGDQAAPHLEFANLAELRLAAARVRSQQARNSRLIGSLSAPVFLARREVFKRLGGFDRRLGIAATGLADFSRRLMLAGFEIALCEDVFLHRVEPETTYSSLVALDANPALERYLQKKWSVGEPSALIHLPISMAPTVSVSTAGTNKANAVSFLACVREERDWQRIAPVVKKVFRLFGAADQVCLVLGASGEMTPTRVAARVRAICDDLALDPERAVDVLISDVSELSELIEQTPPGQRFALFAEDAGGLLDVARDHSPSGLRRTLGLIQNEEVNV